MSETPKEIIAELLHREGVGTGWGTAFLSADIITALTAAGYVIVPRKPTDKMIRAALSTDTDQWTAMIAAWAAEQ